MLKPRNRKDIKLLRDVEFELVKLNQFDNLHHSNQLVVISYENNLSRLASSAFQKMSIISYSNSYFLLLTHSTSMQSPKYCSFDRSIWTRNHRPSIHSIFALLSLMNLPRACSGFGLCAGCLRLIGGSVMGFYCWYVYWVMGLGTFDVVVWFWGTICAILFEIILCGLLQTLPNLFTSHLPIKSLHFFFSH